MDTPIVPAAPIVPVVTPPVSKAPVVENKTALTDNKLVDSNKATADKIKVDSAAEKAVIQKIKVGDTEYDETTLKNMIEKSKGADKKFLEAAQARKEAMRFFKLAKENPREFLEKTGLDPKKFAYDEVAQDIKDKLRPAHEVELEKAQARLKEYEAKEAAEKERVQADKLTKQAKAMEEKFHAQAIAALEKHPSIPKNAFSVAKMAKYIEVVHQKTGELLSFEDVAGVIENDIRGEVAGVVKGASAEQIIALIGEEGVAAIRAYDLARLKDPLKGSTSTSEGTKTKQDKKPVSSKDFYKQIDEQAKSEGYNRFGQKMPR